MLGFSNCERCGYDAFNQTRAVHPMTLNGGVKTALCSKCATEWDEAFRSAEFYPPLVTLEIDNAQLLNAATAGTASTREQLVDIVSRREALTKLMHAFGKEFVNTKPDWANAV